MPERFFMNSQKVYSYFGLLSLNALLMLLSGCAQYKAKPLTKLLIPSSEEQSISFEYHVLDKKECKKYLDRNVISKGYQPIHLTIINNTNKYLNFSLDDFSLLCIAPKKVAKSVHTSTTGRIAGYTVAGILTFGLFFIPAVVDGIGSSKANKQLDTDFQNKSIENRVIAPHRTINGLVFTPREGFEDDFSFVLVSQDGKERFILSSTERNITVE